MILENLSPKPKAPLPHTSLISQHQTFPTPWLLTSPTSRCLTSTTQPQIPPLAHPPSIISVGDVIDSLPSSAINSESLSNIQGVTDRYPKLQSLCKAGSLSCKLAWEAIFGGNVLKNVPLRGTGTFQGFLWRNWMTLSGSGQLVASVLEDSSGIGACVAKMYSKHQYVCNYINKYCRCV